MSSESKSLIDKEWVYENYHGEKIFRIPDGFTEIGECAFMQCENLTEVVFPESLKRIDEWAFYNCPKLKDISLPDNLQSIGREAFEQCQSLKSIYLPDSVAKIESGVFAECKGLKKIRLSEKIKKIPPNAFTKCTSLERIEMSSSVLEIGYSAFAYCDSLKEINIKNVELINDYAFSPCKALKVVNSNNKLQRIGYKSFAFCESLKETDISGSLIKIGYHAFSGCKELAIFDLPECLKKIDAPAFYGTRLMEDKMYLEVNNIIHEVNHSEIKQDTILRIPEGIHTIQPEVLDGLRARTIYFPKSLESYSGSVSCCHVWIEGNISAFDKYFFVEGRVFHFKAEGEVPYSILLEGSRLESNNEKALYDFLRKPSYEKFSEINNSDYKTSIAIAYGMSQNDEFKEYQKYLRRAGSKVMMKIIKDENYDALNFYAEANVFTPKMYDAGIRYTIESENHEAFIMLTQYKNIYKGYDKKTEARFDL